MSWVDLGTIKMSYEWQSALTVDTRYEVFQFIHRYQEKPVGYGLVAFDLPNVGQLYGDRLYPDKERATIQIHPALNSIVAASPTRMPVLKISARTRVYDFEWYVNVRAWKFDDSDSSPDETSQPVEQYDTATASYFWR